jgi:hypothetical protein
MSGVPVITVLVVCAAGVSLVLGLARIAISWVAAGDPRGMPPLAGPVRVTPDLSAKARLGGPPTD